MKDFLKLIKNPKEFIQYIIRNILNNLIKIIEIMGLNMGKALLNLFINIFSLVPKIPVVSPATTLEKFEDKNKNNSKTETNSKASKKVKISSDLAAFNSGYYQDNLLDIEEPTEGVILPDGYDLSTPTNNNYDHHFKRKTAICNDKSLTQWKSNPSVARPWYKECSKGLCYNFNTNNFDDVSANDMGFVATI